MKKVYVILPFLLLMLTLASCGEAATTTSTTTTPNKPVATTIPTPTPVPQPKTAVDVLTALKANIPTIGESFTYTEDNDVNKLLGRPGQYTGKINFKDTRVVRQYINNTGAKIEVNDGGSIETFASATDAQSRFKYIQAISKSGGMFAEYEYINGTVILRVSNELAPSKAKEYEMALKSIV